MNDKNAYSYDDEKYSIIGFEVNKRESMQYNLEKIYGIGNSADWIFNINNKLIGFESCGNFRLDSYSALVDNGLLHVLTDFDYYSINLDTLECEIHLDLSNCAPFDEIHMFNKGYVLIGEMDIIYVENDKIKWMYNSSTYFEYVLVCKDETIEVVENEPYKKIIIGCNGKIL